jgi:hypothetical protein
MNDTVFQALASALPFATSTHSLGVDATSYAQHGRFEQFDLPWIANAIFHPQAKASSWRRLGIKTPPLPERGANVMAAMARGNNLLALLNGKASESDVYYSARLLKGAIVKAEADASSDAVFIVASQRRLNQCDCRYYSQVDITPRSVDSQTNSMCCIGPIRCERTTGWPTP